jgi:protein deglycase
MASPRVLVPLAGGFEEIEAITIIDVLRRAGCEVVAAGLSEGPITASRGTRHLADARLEDVLEAPWDAIVLPGGRPGADALAAHAGLRLRLAAHFQAGGLTAAVCAAPMALDAAGVLRGRRFTCHPSASRAIRSRAPTGARVETDGPLITGQAAGSALEFALEVVRALCGEARRTETNRGLLAALP